jgi:hypothetical protein
MKAWVGLVGQRNRRWSLSAHRPQEGDRKKLQQGLCLGVVVGGVALFLLLQAPIAKEILETLVVGLPLPGREGPSVILYLALQRALRRLDHQKDGIVIGSDIVVEILERRVIRAVGVQLRIHRRSHDRLGIRLLLGSER